jgi:hypothetical protein
MKPEAQRIKIAEACAWTITKDVSAIPSLWVITNGTHTKRVASHKTKDAAYLIAIPDYLNDLNAIMKAVKSLPYELLATYMTHLFYVLIRVKGEAGVSEFDKHTADPEYCAEAFLKTYDLWEEES